MWVWISAPDIGWTFFHIFCCKNCNVCLKRQKIMKKRLGLAHFYKNENLFTWHISGLCGHVQNVFKIKNAFNQKRRFGKYYRYWRFLAMATPSGNQHQNQQYLETFLLLLLLLLLTSVQMYLYLQEDKKKGKKINREQCDQIKIAKCL